MDSVGSDLDASIDINEELIHDPFKSLNQIVSEARAKEGYHSCHCFKEFFQDDWKHPFVVTVMEGKTNQRFFCFVLLLLLISWVRRKTRKIPMRLAKKKRLKICGVNPGIPALEFLRVRNSIPGLEYEVRFAKFAQIIRQFPRLLFTFSIINH